MRDWYRVCAADDYGLDVGCCGGSFGSHIQCWSLSPRLRDQQGQQGSHLQRSQGYIFS